MELKFDYYSGWIPVVKETICKFCGKDTSKGMSFNANSEDSDWKHLDFGEHAHAECYIHECVRWSSKELQDKKDEKDN